MHHAIHCPSGLIGVLRPLSMREEPLLTDRELARTGRQVDALLRACWVEVLDPGPYTLGEGPLDWGKVLQCDRFYALLQLRVASYGPSYAFAVNCDACRARINWQINLTDLPTRTLATDSRATFAGGNRFETHLPDAAKTAWFKLLNGDEERELPQLRKQSQDRPLSSLLNHRVLEIAGIPEKDKRAYIEQLSMRDANHLISEFDRVDGGVDTAIQIECTECFAVQDVDLPFSAGLFMPSQMKATPARRSASSRR
jgi:hypothetical protein